MTTSDTTPYEILGVLKNVGYVKLGRVCRRKIHQHLENNISDIKFRHICRACVTLSDFDKRDRYNSP